MIIDHVELFSFLKKKISTTSRTILIVLVDVIFIIILLLVNYCTISATSSGD